MIERTRNQDKAIKAARDWIIESVEKSDNCAARGWQGIAVGMDFSLIVKEKKKK